MLKPTTLCWLWLRSVEKLLVRVAAAFHAVSIVIISGGWRICSGTGFRSKCDCGRAVFSAMPRNVPGAFSPNAYPRPQAAMPGALSRMQQALCWLGLAWGGEAGTRTAQRLGLIVSGDTLLRHLRRMGLAQKPNPNAPRVLGLDDWAGRKGQRYGTIVCDLERRRVVDLLPDRQARTAPGLMRKLPAKVRPTRYRSRIVSTCCAICATLEHVLTRHAAMLEPAFQQLPPRSTLRHWMQVRWGVRGRRSQSSLSPPRKRPSPRQLSLLLQSKRLIREVLASRQVPQLWYRW